MDFPYFNKNLERDMIQVRERIARLENYKFPSIVATPYIINNMKNVTCSMDLMFCPKLLVRGENDLIGKIFAEAGRINRYCISLDEGDFLKYNLISNYFQDKNIAAAKRRDGDSAEVIWNKYKDEIVKFAAAESIPDLRDAIYNFIIKKGFGVEVGTFRPNLAAGFANVFYKGLIDNKCRVLDICSGWGDRMIGFAAAGVERYVGVDPNPDLSEGYKLSLAIVKDVVPAARTADIKMINSPFETAELPANGGFNLIFTSPPYFDLEIYSDKDGQSLKSAETKKASNNTFENWFEDFLMTSLLKAWKYLEPGGLMCININNYLDFTDKNNIKFGPDYTMKMVHEVNKRIGGCNGSAIYCGPLCYAEFYDVPAAIKDKVKKNKKMPKSPQPFWIWRKAYSVDDKGNKVEISAEKELIDTMSGNKTTAKGVAGTVCSKTVEITYNPAKMHELTSRADIDTLRGIGVRFKTNS